MRCLIRAECLGLISPATSSANNIEKFRGSDMVKRGAGVAEARSTTSVTYPAPCRFVDTWATSTQLYRLQHEKHASKLENGAGGGE